MAIPGIFIYYCYRYDKAINGILYSIMGFLGLLAGYFIWIVQAMFNKHAWPVSIFADTGMVLFVFLWSLRYAEFQTLWQGIFYDKDLMEPAI